MVVTALAIAKAWDTDPFAGWPSCGVSNRSLTSVLLLIAVSAGYLRTPGAAFHKLHGY